MTIRPEKAGCREPRRRSGWTFVGGGNSLASPVAILPVFLAAKTIQRTAEGDCLENRNKPYSGVQRADTTEPRSPIWSSFAAKKHDQQALQLFSRQSQKGYSRKLRTPRCYRVEQDLEN